MGMHAQMPKLRLLLTRKGGGKLKLEYEKSADSIEREMKEKKTWNAAAVGPCNVHITWKGRVEQ
jgi:hypothetical protein